MYGVDDESKVPIGLKPGVGKKQTSFDVTNTPQAQKIVPGYSGFPPARHLQAASDAGKQRKAVAADAVQNGLTRLAGGAVDSAMQLGAQENAGVLPPSQGGSVTPILSPERVVQIKGRQAAPLIAGVNQAIDQSGRVPNGVQLPGINQSLSPMAKQAPLPEPRGLTAQPATPSAADNYANGLAGAGKVALNSTAYVGNVIDDGVRNAVGYLSEGNTDQIKQYRHDSAAKVGEGFDQMATASANLREGAQQSGRDLLGIEKSPSAPSASPIASASAGELPAPAAGTPTPTATAQAGPASDAGPQAPSNGFAPVGLDPKQYGASNDKIVGRVGANGVPEFSNDAADVAGASGQFQAPTGLKPQTQSSQQVAPNGAQTLASGTNMPTEPRGLAATGRASNIGNGVGTFSVMGQPGDAAKAIATYDRANAIRAETNKLAQAGEPRGLHIVKDSSRAPSIADMQNAKLEARQAQTADTQARGLRADRQLDIETSRNQTNDALNNQKTALDIQSGQLGLESAQRSEQLRQLLADPNIQGEQRAQLEAAYASLANGEKDRYMQVTGGTNDSGGKDASTVFDKRTGKMIKQSGGSGRVSVAMSEVESTAKARGLTNDQVIKELQAKGVTVSG